jgi:hypothetical protein
MANLPGQFACLVKEFEEDMHTSGYVVSVERDSELINRVISRFVDKSAGSGFNPFRDQFKTYSGPARESCYNKVGEYSFDATYLLNLIDCGGELAKIKLVETNHASCDLQRRVRHVKSNQVPKDRLKLKFEAVDTDELKNIEITVNGDEAIYKVGEGETSNYHIPNDKKLWETQFIVCSRNGQYFIRDMGFVHNSRVKLDQNCEVQIQKDSVVDLGKVVHYHFDKVVHEKIPDASPNPNFYVLRPELGNYDVVEDNLDLAEFRARHVWISSDEILDNIQKEIFKNTQERSG